MAHIQNAVVSDPDTPRHAKRSELRVMSRHRGHPAYLGACTHRHVAVARVDEAVQPVTDEPQGRQAE
jgi:hypothetical protein